MKEVVPLLALYWGAKIRFDYEVDGSRRNLKNGAVNAETLSLIEEYPIENLYLYLKSLRDLNPKDLLFIAQAVTEDKDVKFEYETFEEGFSIYNSIYWIDIYTNTFAIAASMRESGDELLIRTLPEIVDYLRLKHYDLSGLIDKGLAVEIVS